MCVCLEMGTAVVRLAGVVRRAPAQVACRCCSTGWECREVPWPGRGVRGDAGAGGRGCERRRDVTADTVTQLCERGELNECVGALGVLVQTDCFVSKSLFYVVLQGCVAKKDLAVGRRVHALAVKKGFESDTFLCNHFLRMYASEARVEEAMEVFNLVAKPDAFTWSAIISAHVKHGRYEQAIQLYRRMRRWSSVKPDDHVFVAVLQACTRASDLVCGQEVHADVSAGGAASSSYVCSALVDMYAKCGSLEDARRVFDGIGVGVRDVVTWNAMIAGYSRQGMGQEALRLYDTMEEEGTAVPNVVTFACVLQACAGVGTLALEEGKRLHAQIAQRGLEAHGLAASSLVNMYAKCGSLEDARNVFDGLCKKDVVTWNSMIAGYSQQGMGQEALRLCDAMQGEVAVPTSVTFVCFLQACASVGALALEKGKQLHAQIIEQGLQGCAFVGSSLVNMYARCGSLEDAERVFEGLGQKDVVMWSAMIAAYCQLGMVQQALRLYSKMQEEGMVPPDDVTFVCLLQACASVGTLALEMGRQLHAQIRRGPYQGHVLVSNSLISMYAKCGSLEDAQGVFAGLTLKDVGTWNAMIAAYSQQGKGHHAFHLYNAMREQGWAMPDSVTFTCLVRACESMGDGGLEKGKQLHEQIRAHGHQNDMSVANRLVNMYAKCGSLDDARSVFDGLNQKDLVMWNAMLAGYSQQGMVQEAFLLYNAMREGDMATPDSVTFVCLLQTCASVGALDVGRQLHAQIKEQGLHTDVLTATSLINMYGKSGSMVDAEQVFKALTKRDVVAWNALIAGYALQGDSETVFHLFQEMAESGLKPDNSTFLSVLTVCSHKGLVKKGQEYFEAVSKYSGATPTMEHYTCMVDLLGRSGRLKEALALVSTMPEEPDAAVWHNVLGACQKWSNVEMGQRALHEVLKLDKKAATACVVMSNIYNSAQMWEQAWEMHARRIRTRAWKGPGQSWWTDENGLVHSFMVGSR